MHGAIEFRVHKLIQRHRGSSDMVLCTDGSITKGDKTGWGFVTYYNGRVVTKRSGVIAVSTSGMRMEIEAVSAAIG